MNAQGSPFQDNPREEMAPLFPPTPLTDPPMRDGMS
jgi:hypothetical protein